MSGVNRKAFTHDTPKISRGHSSSTVRMLARGPKMKKPAAATPDPRQYSRMPAPRSSMLSMVGCSPGRLAKRSPTQGAYSRPSRRALRSQPNLSISHGHAPLATVPVMTPVVNTPKNKMTVRGVLRSNLELTNIPLVSHGGLPGLFLFGQRAERRWGSGCNQNGGEGCQFSPQL